MTEAIDAGKKNSGNVKWNAAVEINSPDLPLHQLAFEYKFLIISTLTDLQSSNWKGNQRSKPNVKISKPNVKISLNCFTAPLSPHAQKYFKKKKEHKSTDTCCILNRRDIVTRLTACRNIPNLQSDWLCLKIHPEIRSNTTLYLTNKRTLSDFEILLHMYKSDICCRQHRRCLLEKFCPLEKFSDK